ncbi:MAG: hypothetical protein WA828_20790, partial [Coleofasciculaceae cyanobacterium]
MEYWEFLLQKEGERSWQPLKLEKLTVEPGRYRIVAHSSRTNADVEICVTHTTIEEVPPRRRSQKRSRRTNSEGLMVVIPFTYLKSGMWELRCGGDIMSDFLGKSWQNLIQLEVLATQKGLSTVETTPSPVVEQTELTSSVEPASQDTVAENGHNVNTSVLESQPEIPSQNSNNGAKPELEPIPVSLEVEPEPIPVSLVEVEPELVPVSLVEVETLIPFDLDELDADSINSKTDTTTPSNPILEQSLQMLEQILQ